MVIEPVGEGLGAMAFFDFGTSFTGALGSGLADVYR
jgi:hypothetical protein